MPVVAYQDGYKDPNTPQMNHGLPKIPMNEMNASRGIPASCGISASHGNLASCGDSAGRGDFACSGDFASRVDFAISDDFSVSQQVPASQMRHSMGKQCPTRRPPVAILAT